MQEVSEISKFLDFIQNGLYSWRTFIKEYVQ